MADTTPKPPIGAAPAPHRRGLRPPRTFLMVAAAAALIVIAAAVWSAARPTSPAASRTTSQASPSASSSATPKVAISAGRTPSAPLVVPPGFTVHVFADNLGLARDLQFSPGGTLLVSDPAAHTVTTLADTNHDGVADSHRVVISGGTGHGLAFFGNQLFVAEIGRVNRYNWDEAKQTATFDKTILTLPNVDGHTNRTLSINASGELYLTIGSTCNVCHEPNPQHATILISDINGANPHTFATGLRNAAFSAVNPRTGELWATENGRDNLGDNLPPDEINIIREGQNYGWPFCYGNKIHDTQFDPRSTDPCGSTIPPIFEVPAHNAPLGLAFIKSSQFPASAQGDLIVAYHGSWNRTVPDGYKLVHLTVRGNAIVGTEDFMTGFITGRTVAARPVDITFDQLGNLYVSDDKTGTIYIVQKQS